MTVTTRRSGHLGIARARVQRARTSQFLASELRNMILFGELEGQSQLPPEADFAEQLGVSRHHLREALRLLEQDGLVRVRPGRNGGIFLTVPEVGVMTRSFSGILARHSTTVADVTTARLVIEPAAAALAAEVATEDELDALEAVIQTQEAGPRERQALNSQFHVGLTAVAHNHTLLLLMEALREVIGTLDLCTGAATASATQVQDQLHSDSTHAHRRILRAVRSRDSRETAELVRRHLLGYEGRLLGLGIDLHTLTVRDLLRTGADSAQFSSQDWG